jgi:hypothetical protein
MAAESMVHKIEVGSFEWVGAMCRLQDKVKLKAQPFVLWSLYTEAVLIMDHRLRVERDREYRTRSV